MKSKFMHNLSHVLTAGVSLILFIGAMTVLIDIGSIACGVFAILWAAQIISNLLAAFGGLEGGKNGQKNIC